MKTKLVNLMFACNHPDNGMFTGRTEFAEVEWPDETSMRIDFWETSLQDVEGQLRVGRVRCQHKGCSEWVGNWCWNSWQVMPADAVKILRYLFQRRHATYEERAVEGIAEKVYRELEQSIRKVNQCHSQ